MALRKVETLLRYGADVHVTAEEICDEIRARLSRERLKIGHVTDQELKESFLVIAATSSRETNRKISDFCRRHNILVNVIDCPEECSFLFPAVVLKGDISVGINTGGKSPIVSSKVRKSIEEAVPDYYVQIADQLGELRSYVKKHFEREDDRKNILKKTAEKAFLEERTLSEEEIKKIVGQVVK